MVQNSLLQNVQFMKNYKNINLISSTLKFDVLHFDHISSITDMFGCLFGSIYLNNSNK